MGDVGRFSVSFFDWGITGRHVLSNSAGTIYQQSAGVFTLPPSLRGNIAAIFTGPPADLSRGKNPIQLHGTQLLRPVDLGFNTGVANPTFNTPPLTACGLTSRT